jgi:hypothetical protein
MVKGQNNNCEKLKNLYVKKEARQESIRGNSEKNPFNSNHFS